MNEAELNEIIKSIKPAGRQAIINAKARQAALAKPPGSLGLLEEISIRIAGMTGQETNRIGKGCTVVFCADNGVAREGVASAPQSVTRAQTINFTRRLTGVGALARSYDSELLIVDMGVKDPIPQELYTDKPLADTHKIVNRRLRRSGQTDNIAEGPAMTVAEALQAIGTGLEMAGAPGTTAALALLNDAVKKGGVMASNHVGGLSGAFIPVSEDIGMIEAAAAGQLTLEKLEAMTCVCSVGLDMIAIPGDTSAETISGIIADEAAIGMVNSKTTAVRVIPAVGKKAGDTVEFGGLLGFAPVMPVNTCSNTDFIARGGRIPAPLQSLKN